MASTHQQPPPSKNTVVGEARIPLRGYLRSSRIEPTSSSSEESTSFSDVDGEVSQHLKKLGRKDPTTKLKALASLCLLFKKKSGEELAQIVPQWAFEYKRLVLDYNREVRWGTHDAMTSLVTTVGKDLVPHLTSLMGPWWFAQFDPIIEVSQAAKRSLEENTSTATNQVNTQAGPGASVTVEKDLVSQAEKRTWRLFLARMYFHHSFRMLRSILIHSKIWYVMGIGEAEAFSERLKRELLALETDNVHALLENEPLVEEL